MLSNLNAPGGRVGKGELASLLQSPTPRSTRRKAAVKAAQAEVAKEACSANPDAPTLRLEGRFEKAAK